MTRVGLVHLTPEQLELMSAMAERPDLEVVGAVHADRGATAFKIAQVLAIPTHTEVESLRSAGPDLVVVADDGANDLRRAVLALGLDSEVLTTREAARRLGLVIDSPSESSASTATVATAAAAAAREPAPGPSFTPPPIPPSAAAPSEPPAAIGTHGAPHLELMLRDEMEELLGAAGQPAAIAILSKVLHQVATAWADLLGAESCAIGLTDPDLPADLHWVAGGTGVAPTGLDSIARETLATGVPVTYVRHDGAFTLDREPTPLRQAIAAFPLESVAGVVWFRNVRLPAHEVEERLQVLRRAARRLGRVLGLATRVVSLERERDDFASTAELALAVTNGAGRDEIVAKLKAALASALAPAEIVFRFESGAEREDGPPALRTIAELLAPEVRRATMPVLAPVVLDGRPAHALGGAIRQRGEHLGMVIAIRPEGDKDKGVTFTAREIAALDRLLRHAAPGLGASAPIAAAHGNGILDRRALENLVAGEVRRSDRYGTPLLLTVLELEAAPGGIDPDSALLQAFPIKLKTRLRDLDRVAALGPGRIAVLCPHTDRQGGRVVMRAKEVLAGLASDSGPLAGPSPIVRGNQVQYPGDAASLEELLTRLG